MSEHEYEMAECTNCDGSGVYYPNGFQDVCPLCNGAGERMQRIKQEEDKSMSKVERNIPPLKPEVFEEVVRMSNEFLADFTSNNGAEQ